MGAGAPPVLTDTVGGSGGWLSLWHGAEPSGQIGIYRTYWTLLDAHEPWRVVATGHTPLIEPNPALTQAMKDQMCLDNVVFTTGIADAGDHWMVASGEADLACRITHVPKGLVG